MVGRLRGRFRRLFKMAWQKRPLVAYECQEQEALFEWAELAKRQYPELERMSHYPIGGKRDKAVAAALKRQGAKADLPDVFLPAMRGGYGGLYVELKRTKGGTLRDGQKAAIADLRAAGYRVDVCKGWEPAKDAIIDYLGLPKQIPSPVQAFPSKT